MKAGALFQDKKVIAGIILVVILAVAFATADTSEDDEKSGSTSSEAEVDREFTVETEEFSGVATGIVGIGMNGEHTFEVREGAFRVIVNLSGGGITDQDDLDLELEGASGGSATSGDQSSEESIILKELDIMKRFGYGTYTATAIAYAALGTPYDMHVEVWYWANGTA